MHLLWTLLIGLVIGAVAKFLLPGKDPGGIIVTMLIGIAGSFVATYLGRVLGWYQEGQSAGFIMSVLGAILLLDRYHLIRRKTAWSPRCAERAGEVGKTAECSPEQV